MNEEFFKSLSVEELKAYKQRLQIRNKDMNSMVEYMKKENENLDEMKTFLSNHQQHITLLLKRQETRENEKIQRKQIFTTIIQNGVNMLPSNLNPKNLINYFSNPEYRDGSAQPPNDEDYQKKISNKPDADDIIFKPYQNLYQKPPQGYTNNLPQQIPVGQRQRKKIFEDPKPLYNPPPLSSLIQQNQPIQQQSQQQDSNVQQVLQQQQQQIQPKEQNDKENGQNIQQSQKQKQPLKQNKVFEEDESYNIEQDSI